MKAVRYHSYGGGDVLVYEDAERPVADAGEVLVKVAGTSFNPVDAQLRAGHLREVFPLVFPHVPGFDVAGIVAEAGAGVAGWRAGDAVVAFLPMTGPGAAAEYVAAPAGALAAAPRSVPLADAAALPSSGLTAWQLLFEHADLKAGQSVLVNGGGGAVGGYVVQLAARAGGAVTATAGPRSGDRLRCYGAGEIIDYTATPLPEAVAGRRFDVVLNLVRNGPEDAARLADVVADGGTFVSITAPGPRDAARGVRVVQMYVRSDAAQLTELVSRVDSGDLRIDVAQRRPLADLAAVHDEAAKGDLPGKTVLTP